MFVRQHRRRAARALAALLASAFLALPLAPAQAEGQLRIVEQFGLTYLPFYVIRDRGLIEKHAREIGVEVEPEWRTVSGGAAANDALLSGSVDVVAAGLAPLLTIWDRTRGSIDVRGIAGLAMHNSYLVTSNPNVKTIADFTAADKIAVPSVGVSQQARTLQFAAAKLFGKDEWKRLDQLTVALPHPDAVQALISGNGSITAHFSNEPFQSVELADPKLHKVLDSNSEFGGPATSTVLYGTASWREENPKTYAVLLAALDEADAFIRADPEGAADIFIRGAQSKLDRALVVKILKSPDQTYDPVPHNTAVLANFMHEVGAIRNKPESWRDYFFDDIHDRPGS